MVGKDSSAPGHGGARRLAAEGSCVMLLHMHVKRQVYCNNIKLNAAPPHRILRTAM